MKVIALIPVRMNSTRFPGKPLADLCGLPMVEHVRRRVQLSPVFDEVVVATCDQEIKAVVEDHGGIVIETADTHERCTDRIAEAALSLEADIVVNVQGDEPLVHPDMFGPLIAPLQDDPDLLCTNLMAKIGMEDFNNRDVIKAVCDLKGNALYFSREPIPSINKAETPDFEKLKQLGIIAFRRDFLLEFAKLPQTPLEQVESVDMLRVMENGIPIRMVETPFNSIGVDTPQQLETAKTLMQNDPFFPQYR